MAADQFSDYTGAAALPGSLPAAGRLIADRSYDADRARDAPKGKGIRPAPRPKVAWQRRPIRQVLQAPKPYEIMFGRLKDWHRSAATLAATTFFCL